MMELARCEVGSIKLHRSPSLHVNQKRRDKRAPGIFWPCLTREAAMAQRTLVGIDCRWSVPELDRGGVDSLDVPGTCKLQAPSCRWRVRRRCKPLRRHGNFKVGMKTREIGIIDCSGSTMRRPKVCARPSRSLSICGLFLGFDHQGLFFSHLFFMLLSFTIVGCRNALISG